MAVAVGGLMDVRELLPADVAAARRAESVKAWVAAVHVAVWLAW